MAKMGISTMQSYKCAQIFEAVGLAKEVIDKCFKGSMSRLGGVTFDLLAKEALERHRLAFGDRECDTKILRNPGFLHYRSGGEKHINDPESIALLQEATKHDNKSAFSRTLKNRKLLTIKLDKDTVTNISSCFQRKCQLY